jgi:hypothetical protein
VHTNLNIGNNMIKLPVTREDLTLWSLEHEDVAHSVYTVLKERYASENASPMSEHVMSWLWQLHTNVPGSVTHRSVSPNLNFVSFYVLGSWLGTWTMVHATVLARSRREGCPIPLHLPGSDEQ